MKLIFNRPLKALFAIIMVAQLAACGSSSTVDPFKPTRAIGLGDAYNDTGAAQATVRGTGQTSTVVAEMAALYGASTIDSKASSLYAGTADLIAQIGQLGNLSGTTDLVVITAGTEELRAGVSGATFLGNLKTALDALKSKGAKHIVIMEVIDIAAGATDQATLNFNTTVKGGLSAYTDVARYGNINRPSAYFPGWATTGATPYCVNPTILDGCAIGDAGNQTGDVATYFLADNLHPTPAGNQWLGIQLFNATGGGWR